jgi:integrase
MVGQRGNSLHDQPALRVAESQAANQQYRRSTGPAAENLVTTPDHRSGARRSHPESVMTISALPDGTAGRVVVELGCGVVVYPARFAGDRWRAVWYEGGRRCQCEAVTEDRLAVRVEKVLERLAADAPGMERPGGELIAFYLSPSRHPAGKGWSRKHADTQRRLCARYLAPVIGDLACEDIKAADMQTAVNAAPTASEGDRVRRCVSALVHAGIASGYLTSPRLRLVHWQPGTRPEPPPVVTVAGESALFVDPTEIPATADVAGLGQALAAQQDLYELMANFAAYTGLRWGELAALTTAQIGADPRTVEVDRKVIEIGGKLFTEAPKGRKRRRTIYPRQTPGGYPLAEKVTARIGQARAEQCAGTNPLGLMFPSLRGRHWRSSNFARRVLAPAYHAARWRDATGEGPWTWHSLRHVFCTTALFTWHIDPADVSRLAGHANIRITLDMYIGTTAGTLDRARTATQ